MKSKMKSEAEVEVDYVLLHQALSAPSLLSTERSLVANSMKNKNVKKMIYTEHDLILHVMDAHGKMRVVLVPKANVANAVMKDVE